MKSTKRGSKRSSAALTAALVTVHAATTASLANETAAIEMCHQPTDGAAAPCPQPETKQAHVERRPSDLPEFKVASSEPVAPNVGRRFDDLGPFANTPMFKTRIVGY